MSTSASTSALETACLRIAEETVATIAAVLDDLDDDTVNATPLPPTVNSVFVLVTHLDGVVADWGGNLVAGEHLPRDRAAEFTARGSVAHARALLDRIAERLPRYLHLALTDGIADRGAIGSTRADAASSTPEFVVVHLLRELTQHTGQMEICRDLVRSARTSDELS